MEDENSNVKNENNENYFPNELELLFEKSKSDEQILDISDYFLEKDEKLNKYEKINCIYNKKSNLINVLMDDKANYGDLSKSLIIKLIEYAHNNNINGIIISVSKNNVEYYKIIQSLLVIGFENIENHKSNKIGKKSYKILYMKINKELNKIEDIMI